MAKLGGLAVVPTLNPDLTPGSPYEDLSGAGLPFRQGCVASSILCQGAAYVELIHNADSAPHDVQLQDQLTTETVIAITLAPGESQTFGPKGQYFKGSVISLLTAANVFVTGTSIST